MFYSQFPLQGNTVACFGLPYDQAYYQFYHSHSLYAVTNLHLSAGNLRRICLALPVRDPLF